MTGKNDDTPKTVPPTDMLTPAEVEALRQKEREDDPILRAAFAPPANASELLTDVEIAALRQKSKEDAAFALAAFGASTAKKVVDDAEAKS